MPRSFDKFLMALLGLLLTPLLALAQAEGESPYSSSTVDNASEGALSTNGPLIVVALIVGALLVFFVLRGRSRT